MKSRREWVSEREGTIVPLPGATWHHDHRRKGFFLSPREERVGREPERGADLTGFTLLVDSPLLTPPSRVEVITSRHGGSVELPRCFPLPRSPAASLKFLAS